LAQKLIVIEKSRKRSKNEGQIDFLHPYVLPDQKYGKKNLSSTLFGPFHGAIAVPLSRVVVVVVVVGVVVDIDAQAARDSIASDIC